MMRSIIMMLLLGCTFCSSAFGLERPGVEFKIFQFPHDMIPRIDGDSADWDIVPDSYAVGMNELVDNVYDAPVDTADKDVRIRVGWVQGMSRLYFCFESYDDYWRISDDSLINDIFEIVVDADLDGSAVIKQMHPDQETIGTNELHYTMHGVFSQNYHVFTPPGPKEWCFVWGCANWAKYLPYANAAYSVDFEDDGSGRLVAEFFITPFDYASCRGPENAVISTLTENEIIGLTWGVSDYDEYIDPAKPVGNNYDGQFNLSHQKGWFTHGANLCAFRLMPIEEAFSPKIKARATFTILDMEKRIVAFTDRSTGTITKWTWNFNDGAVSHEQHPVHRFDSPGGKPVTLTVEGPEGTSLYPFVYEEIFLK